MKELSDKEKYMLERIAGRKNLYLTFSIISVIIAVMLLLYHGLVMKNLNTTKTVLIVLVLLAGRSHLRQYRSALILGKLKLWLERKDV